MRNKQHATKINLPCGENVWKKFLSSEWKKLSLRKTDIACHFVSSWQEAVDFDMQLSVRNKFIKLIINPSTPNLSFLVMLNKNPKSSLTQ